jgi:hypothetical protein
MATSGTTTFDLPFGDIAEEAWERAGSEIRGGYDLRTTRRSLNLLLVDWANRGVNLWTIASNSITLVPGQATYALTDAMVDIIEAVIRTAPGDVNNQTDITISRISVSTYVTLPNKLTQGRPIQMWIQRGTTANTTDSGVAATVWPTPDNSMTYTLVYYFLRRLYDAGATATQTTDVPYRFLEALTAGLAFKIAQKIPEGAPRLQMLKQEYLDVFQAAIDEDREKAPVRFIPRIGAL